MDVMGEIWELKRQYGWKDKSNCPLGVGIPA